MTTGMTTARPRRDPALILLQTQRLAAEFPPDTGTAAFRG